MLVYTVRCSPSILAPQMIFFSTKKFFVFVDETATPTQILCTAYGKKPVRKTWQTPFIDYSPYVVSPLFRCCSRTVYSRLQGSSYTKNEYSFFNQKVDVEYFFIRQFFQKKLYFQRKPQKTVLVAHLTIF